MVVVKKSTLISMHDALLCQMAVEASEKYKAAAYQLADSMREIIAIDALIAEAGIKQSLVYVQFHQGLWIPPLSNIMSSNDHGDYFFFLRPNPLPNRGYAKFKGASNK